MSDPLFLPGIKTNIINGEDTVCSAGFASLLCNVAVGRMQGHTNRAKKILLSMAQENNRTGFESVLNAAKSDDEAMKDLLREAKVLLDLKVEKAFERVENV